MVLTGPEIENKVANHLIEIEPYVAENVGPNSIDMRLHEELFIYDTQALWERENVRLGYDAKRGSIMEWQRKAHPILSMTEANPVKKLLIPEEGLVLMPGTLYLGRTIERMHTKHYVAKVDGRSSVGRLGMNIHATAGFIDTGFDGTITLEISVTHPVRVVPNVRICQVWFMEMQGETRLYEGRYQGQVEATASRFHTGRETVRMTEFLSETQITNLRKALETNTLGAFIQNDLQGETSPDLWRQAHRLEHGRLPTEPERHAYKFRLLQELGWVT